MILYNKRNNKFKPIFVHKFLVLGSSLFDIYMGKEKTNLGI